MKISAAIEIDEADLKGMIRRIVKDEIASSMGRLAEVSEEKARQFFFVSSRHPGDVLRVVEAPDTTAPNQRNEPHWRVLQDMRENDVVLFRNSIDGQIVGYGLLDWRETGSHRHQPDHPAIRWWVKDAVHFERAVPDQEFHEIFEELDDGNAGFRLFTNRGHFSQKTYAYPLNEATAKATLLRAGCSEEE